MNRSRVLRHLAFAGVLAFVAGAVNAYVLLSPRRTWDAAPNYRVDSRGQSSIADGDFGRNRTRNAIVSSVLRTWPTSPPGAMIGAPARSPCAEPAVSWKYPSAARPGIRTISAGMNEGGSFCRNPRSSRSSRFSVASDACPTR